MEHRAQITRAEDVRRFVLAGRAVFTLVSRKTGQRFTYRVTRPDGDDSVPPKNIWFVGVLTGQDNTGDYAYLGQVWPPRGSQVPGRLEFTHGCKAKVHPEALSAVAARWFFDNLLGHGEVSSSVEFWHEGTCCRCGRPLTVPESIRLGVGPECADKVGVAYDHAAAKKQKDLSRPRAAPRVEPADDSDPREAVLAEAPRPGYDFDDELPEIFN
jgi:Family of unknown function (DUF6011)